MKNKVFITVCILFLFDTSIYARNPRDVLTPLSLIKSGVTARALGMGNAFTALPGDVNSIYYNPSGLASLKEQQFSVTYQKVFESQTIDMESIFFAFPYLDRIGLGGELLFFNASDIQSQIILSETGKTPNMYSINDFVVQLSAGGNFLNSLSIGGSLKFVQSKINDGNASTVGGDFGMMYHTPFKDIILGLSVRNMGGQVFYERQKTSLPLAFSYGASKTFSAIPFVISAEGIKVKNEQTEWNVGGEFTWRNKFFIRAGYDSKNTSSDGVNAGAGLRWRNYQFDYAYVPYREWGRTHTITGTVHFGPLDAPPPSPASKTKRHIKKSKAPKITKTLLDKKQPGKISPVIPEKEIAAKKKTAQDYFVEGDYLKAAELFRREIKLDLNNPELRYNLATCYFLSQRYEEAQREYEYMIQLKPADPDSHLYLGYTYYYMNKPDAAVQEWKTVLKLDPGNEQARQNLESFSR